MDIVTPAIYSVECPHIPLQRDNEKIILNDILSRVPVYSTMAGRHHRQFSKLEEKRSITFGKKPLFVLTLAVVLTITAFYPIATSGVRADPQTAHSGMRSVTTAASSIGIVLVNPGTQGVLPPGTTFTIQVKVNGMSQFNGWDIQIVTAYVINATSLSIAGNIFATNATGGTAFEIVHCVNGRGMGCTSSDGPGVVHSAFGDTAFTSGNGLLFTITFQVLNINPYSPIGLQNTLISSSSPSGVPHTDQSGTYGAPPSGGGSGLCLRS